jgi:hypothetical protein
MDNSVFHKMTIHCLCLSIKSVPMDIIFFGLELIFTTLLFPLQLSFTRCVLRLLLDGVSYICSYIQVQHFKDHWMFRDHRRLSQLIFSIPLIGNLHKLLL